jgi:exosortase B
MPYSAHVAAIRSHLNRDLIWPGTVIVAVIAAYAPTYVKLVEGPWQTEQEGHGPLVIAAVLWLVWESRDRWTAATVAPAPAAGWAVLLSGLALMFLARTQDVLAVEALSEIPVIVGCVLLFAGYSVFRILAFPIAFLIFSVPPQGWMLDAVTVPLKVMVSDTVTQVLYAAGYPIAQNGVVIMIGSYQLLVKDACSGMNSIYALVAIGIFYFYLFSSDAKIRGLLLLAAILPITIAANFVRVTTLVLIAYYFGIERVEGALHDLTGFGLFIVAIALLFLFDGFLRLCNASFRKLWRPMPSSPSTPNASAPQ